MFEKMYNCTSYYTLYKIFFFKFLLFPIPTTFAYYDPNDLPGAQEGLLGFGVLSMIILAIVLMLGMGFCCIRACWIFYRGYPELRAQGSRKDRRQGVPEVPIQGPPPIYVLKSPSFEKFGGGVNWTLDNEVPTKILVKTPDGKKVYRQVFEVPPMHMGI